jgi:hypothetical protein
LGNAQGDLVTGRIDLGQPLAPLEPLAFALGDRQLDDNAAGLLERQINRQRRVNPYNKLGVRLALGSRHEQGRN